MKNNNQSKRIDLFGVNDTTQTDDKSLFFLNLKPSTSRNISCNAVCGARACIRSINLCMPPLHGLVDIDCCYVGKCKSTIDRLC